jgi:hypothetical protein
MMQITPHRFYFSEPRLRNYVFAIERQRDFQEVYALLELRGGQIRLP